MNLFEEEVKSFKPKERKPIKLTTILIIFTVIFLILAILIFVAIIYLRKNVLTIKLNGQEANESILQAITINEDGTIDISIRKMASILDYEIYGGDYETLLEDTNKGYIQYNNEIITYENGSKIISQIALNSGAVKDREKLELQEAIEDASGDMYVDSADAQKILNLYIVYDESKNNIEIYTLNYLYSLYENNFIQSNGYVKIQNQTIQNQKAVLDNMLIVKDSDENYGVVNISNGEVILENKYSSIDYLRSESDFLILRGGKNGIISADKTAKLENYDSIDITTLNEKAYYLITQNNKYGMANSDGEIVIYPEYTKIGINRDQFANNNLKTSYLIADTYVPLQREEEYLLFNINTNSIVDEVYTGLGCIATSNNTYSTIQIPEFALTVLEKDDKYDLITQEGKKLFGFVLDSVYFTMSAGKKTYYVEYNGNTIELLKYLDENGIERVDQ